MWHNWPISALLLFLYSSSVIGQFYSTFTGEQISPAKYGQYRALGLDPYCAQQIRQCDENEPRRLDNSCNNLHVPIRGTIMTPYRRMLAPVFGRNYDIRPQSSGMPLPNVRSVRTSLVSDGRVASKKYTTQLMSGLLAITGDCTTIHDTFNFVVFTPTCCVTGKNKRESSHIVHTLTVTYLRYLKIENEVFHFHKEINTFIEKL